MDDIDKRIERWFATHFHGSPHMRDTDTYNHVRAAVDALKAELGGLSHPDAAPAVAIATPRSEERHLGD